MQKLKTVAGSGTLFQVSENCSGSNNQTVLLANISIFSDDTHVSKKYLNTFNSGRFEMADF